MGIRLVVEVLRHAPETLTHREKLLLVALAEDANDDTRLTWSSVEDSKILVGAKVNRAQLYDVIKKLIAKSALARVTAGQRHAAAKYKILNLVQCQEIPDTDQSQCQQIPDAEKGFSVRESLTRSESQCQEIPGLSVRESLTPTPLLLEIDNSPSPRASPTPVEQPDPFDAFWTAYPRKTAKADARKAFAAAIKAGADPNTLPSTVARHHAHWIAEGRQPQYFPYPATWLRKGSYDDELIAPQPAGPQQSTHQTYADRGIF